MAAMDFPPTPTVGQLYPDPPTVGVPQYRWDGGAWLAVSTPEDLSYVRRTGDTMSGPLTMSGASAMITLAADPTIEMHAVPKRYVDGGVSGIPGKVSKAGDTMTGALVMSGAPATVTLAGDPTVALHAATKQYVDNSTVVKSRIFTASGTYTPDAKMVSCIIECVGGGAGGGGATGAANVFTAVGGGGSGGYSRKYATKADIGVSQTITIGAAGIGVLTTSGSAGSPTRVGDLCVANGGSGGRYYGQGGAGAVVGTGDIAAGGSAGTAGISNTAITTNAIVGWGGSGAGGPFGGGGLASQANGGQAFHGLPATAYGAGGGGSNTHNVAVNTKGGDGSAGLVIIMEFCSQ